MSFYVTENEVSDVRPSIVQMAREQIGTSQYCYLSENCRPPYTVNCAMFVKWLLDQHQLPSPPISDKLLADLMGASYPGGCKDPRKDRHQERPGDLVFFCQNDRKHRFSAYTRLAVPVVFSHVGVLTEKKTVVHACGQRRAVVEDTFDSLRQRRYEHVGTHSLALELCLTYEQLCELARDETSATAELQSYLNGVHLHCMTCYYWLARLQRTVGVPIAG